MQLFGRKASDSPGTAEVPPELQPYYSQPSRWARLRQIGLRILPVVTLVIIVVAIIVAAILWWRHGHPAAPDKTTDQTATNSTGPTTPSAPPASPGSPSSGSQEQQPVTPSTPSQAATGTAQAPTPGATPQASSIPNTGPGTNVLLAAIGSSVGGAALQYYCQIRRLRSSRR